MIQNEKHATEVTSTWQKNGREENIEKYLETAEKETMYASFYAVGGFLIFLGQFFVSINFSPYIWGSSSPIVLKLEDYILSLIYVCFYWRAIFHIGVKNLKNILKNYDRFKMPVEFEARLSRVAFYVFLSSFLITL